MLAVHSCVLVPLLVCALLLGACSSAPPKARTVKAEAERKPAPNFSLKDSDGRTVQLSDYRGKVVLLNFWATWCGPCKIEIPWFINFEREHKDQGFAVLGISMDEDGWDAVKPFMQQVRMNYRVLMGNDAVGQLYGGIDSLPTTFIIDRAGRIAAVHVGLVSKSSYEHDLNQLFQSSTFNTRDRGAGLPAFLLRAR